MKFLPLALLVFVALVSVSTTYAQAPTASLDDYRQAIEKSLSLVEQARALPEAQRAPILEQARLVLEPIRSVQLPSGSSLTVNNDSLFELLKGANNADAASERLTALRAAIAAAPVSVNPNDLTALQTILNNPPFTRPTNTTWWQELLLQLIEFWQSLVGRAANGVFEARSLFVLGGILAVIGVTIYLFRNLRRNLVSEEALSPLSAQNQVTSPAEAFDNAQRFINAGDYRSAVRQLYLATLLILDQRGKIKYDPTLTNRQVLRQAANDPLTTAALVPIVETFDRVWYGFEPLTRSEFDAYRERVEQVRK